jgi:hypothetical protein
MHSLAAWGVLFAVVTSPPPRPRPTPVVGYKMLRVATFHTDDVLQARLASIDAYAAYVKALAETTTGALKETPGRCGLDIVVAVKPGRRARVWFVSTPPAVPGPVVLDALRRQLEAVPAPEVRQGPLAFALIGLMGDALRPREAALDLPPPVPVEWRAAARGKKVDVPDGMIALAWPD